LRRAHSGRRLPLSRRSRPKCRDESRRDLSASIALGGTLRPLSQRLSVLRYWDRTQR
jgi:hypothetical protein